MDGFYRLIEAKLSRLLKSFPVVAILGARQCGKSTLSRLMAPDWEYFDLENPVDFSRINNDPNLFFRQHSQHIIIDEAQKSPQLFETLRGVIDQKRHLKGRFILTGSASFELIKHISESLAGRMALIELAPFKMSEFKGEPLSSFFSIFESKIHSDQMAGLLDLRPSKGINEIEDYLLSGGYPEPVMSGNHEFLLDWMEQYFETYINRDLRDLYPKLDLVKYRRVISMLSALSGTIVNKSEIARSAECSEKTVRDYMQIVAGTYFWRELQAYTTSKIKTTLKLPKGHFRDSGLILFKQNVHSLKELHNYPRLGNIFEGFVVEEIIRGLEMTNARNLSYSHFRTKAGGEIDLILSGSFGTLPIEIKYSSNTTKKQVHSMLQFIELHEIPFGIVFNNCERPSLIDERIVQIPVGCL